MRLTAASAAREFGVDPKTMVARLRKSGHTIRKHEKYSLRDITAALFGDRYKEQARREKAEADLAELSAGEMKRDLIRRDECARFIRETFMPVREQVLALPPTLAAKVNPTDPQHAKAHLEAWRDSFLRVCKEKMP